MRYIKKNILVSFLLLVLVILSCFITKKGLFDSLDNSIYEFFINIRGNKGNAIYWIFRIITEFGYYFVVIGILVVLAILFKFDYRFIIIASSVAFNACFNTCLKVIVKRERPLEALRWMEETSNSFPSGHSTTAFCFYIIIMVCVIKTVSNVKVKRIITIVCPLIVLFVGISRLIMGVHYFTDVVAGFLVASFTISVANIFLDKFNKDKVKT